MADNIAEKGSGFNRKDFLKLAGLGIAVLGADLACSWLPGQKENGVGLPEKGFSEVGAGSKLLLSVGDEIRAIEIRYSGNVDHLQARTENLSSRAVDNAYGYAPTAFINGQRSRRETGEMLEMKIYELTPDVGATRGVGVFMNAGMSPRPADTERKDLRILPGQKIYGLPVVTWFDEKMWADPNSEFELNDREGPKDMPGNFGKFAKGWAVGILNGDTFTELGFVHRHEPLVEG